MTKGIHKQVVVLNEFENSLFEQAIFILRPEAARRHKGAEGVLKEAREVVSNYARKNGIPEGTKAAPRVSPAPVQAAQPVRLGIQSREGSRAEAERLKRRVFLLAGSAVFVLSGIAAFLLFFC